MSHHIVYTNENYQPVWNGHATHAIIHEGDQRTYGALGDEGVDVVDGVVVTEETPNDQKPGQSDLSGTVR